MQTNLSDHLVNTVAGKRAEKILRSCVHCGFCTATCPTYQLLGDELDGPRGRIYQIKQLFEGGEVTAQVRTHLDRCLTCRSCETTCPSGVRYAELLDIGREYVEESLPRPLWQRSSRWLLRKILPYPKRFGFLLGLGRLSKPVLPAVLADKIPLVAKADSVASISCARKVLLLDGCVQSVITPDVNAMASRIFARLGIETVRVAKAGCCGAVSSHLSANAEGRRFIRNNIDAWWPYIEQGVEAIMATASGCGVMLQDYGQIMADDRHYAEKAARVSALVRDPAEILSALDLSALAIKPSSQRIAFHAPCTLQHGLKQTGVVEKILRDLGYQLVDVNDAHLCCGSAGTYSILQPAISQKLLTAKLHHLQADQPELIVTANIGCQMHLQSGSEIPVRHWLSLLNVSVSAN